MNSKGIRKVSDGAVETFIKFNYFTIVMGEIITIDGEKFLGKFKASRRFDDFRGGSEYTEYTYKGYWYEGTGIIEDKKSKEKYVFALRTDHFEERYSPKEWSKENYNLEESVVNFNQKGPFYGDSKPEVVDDMYKKIVDLSLGDMVSQVKNSKESIPTVIPKELKLDDLVKMGYCVGEDGQISLAFSG